LINVKDYPRDLYTAHWQISVLGNDAEGYAWKAQIISTETPVGWAWKGKVTKDRPEVPVPVYPEAPKIRQAEYVRLSAEEQATVKLMQDQHRLACAKIYEANPKPLFVIEEGVDTEDTRDAADTEAQKWVLKRMKEYRRSGRDGQRGHALAMGPIGMIGGILWEFWLFLIGYQATLRNSRLTQVETALDAGAGAALMRIYDGSRPATCGTATTLLAELTCSDPAGSVASQVLTFGAITSDASANATGTATWHRLVDSTGTCVFDGSTGTSGSDLNLNSTSISTGQQVACSAYTITEGNP
jgi:hypothetical protein